MTTVPSMINHLMQRLPFMIALLLVTFRCELGKGQPVFVRAVSRKSCPNVQLFVDDEAGDARW